MSGPPFRKVLIANRGEIAVRVMRACAELGIATVAVYSDADAGALHVRSADEAVYIGPPPATESYLNVGAIVAAALATRADAVHPGYGFLSESASFAQACRDAGLVFIGPPTEAIREMGSKIAAKRLAATLGIPLLPGYDGALQDPATLAAEADRIGYPVLIKASAGGGGRGMRIVRRAVEFREALESASREAVAAFGDGTMLLERYVERPRHVEIQVFGDNEGTVIHLGERECSVQRRHQKVIEESPSPAVTDDLRAAMGDAAVRLARAIGYTSAGTVEFLLDDDLRFAFLEMNTRLQVEHGVTELVTGIDLVHLQIRVAAGEPLPIRQEDVRFRGHAIECRIYAEDPARGFLPSTGVLARFTPPEGPGVRNDIGVRSGDTVSPYYDPMLAKLLVVGATRTDAVARTAQALGSYEIDGVATNLPILLATVTHPAFEAGDTTTGFLEAHVLDSLTPDDVPPSVFAAAGVAHASRRTSAGPWQSGWRATGGSRMLSLSAGDDIRLVSLRRTGAFRWQVEVSGASFAVTGDRDSGRVRLTAGDAEQVLDVMIDGDEISVRDGGKVWRVRPTPPLDVERMAHGGSASVTSGSITAPLSGVVVKVHVHEGDAVRTQQPLVVLEAMKMEHTLVAPGDGEVTSVRVTPGDHVQAGAVLIEIGAGPRASVTAVDGPAGTP